MKIGSSYKFESSNDTPYSVNMDRDGVVVLINQLERDISQAVTGHRYEEAQQLLEYRAKLVVLIKEEAPEI